MSNNLERIKPILFNTEMVRAILEGRKICTRRVVKPQPKAVYHDGAIYYDEDCQVVIVEGQNGRCDQIAAPYRPDDILYLRETWATWVEVCKKREVANGHLETFYYKADYPDSMNLSVKWHPSIHMPKEAARLFLRVKNVRVERLQDIDADGCIREGVYWEDVVPCVASLPDNPAFDMDSIIAEEQAIEEHMLVGETYGKLWDSTIKKADLSRYGWEANPWVWVIEFEKISKEEVVENDTNKG